MADISPFGTCEEIQLLWWRSKTSTWVSRLLMMMQLLPCESKLYMKHQPGSCLFVVQIVCGICEFSSVSRMRCVCWDMCAYHEQVSSLCCWHISLWYLWWSRWVSRLLITMQLLQCWEANFIWSTNLISASSWFDSNAGSFCVPPLLILIATSSCPPLI